MSEFDLKIAQVGEVVLKTKAQVVINFDAELISFSENLINCMEQAGGIGIAAPQVFDPRAIMVIAVKPNKRYPNAPEHDVSVMINPRVLEQSTKMEKDWEGCLSVPGIRGLVPRPNSVKFSYQDLQGNLHTETWDDFMARVFLHEFDHLIGKTWLDRVESNDDVVGEAVYEKLMSLEDADNK